MTSNFPNPWLELDRGMPSPDILACRKVRVNAHGYAYGDQYFGRGMPLYYVEFADGRSGHVRAADRAAAIATAVEKPGHWGIR